MCWNKPLIIFLSLLALSLNSLAQVPYLRQYTVSDGLLTNETYQVYQDHEGYIWIATSLGLNRFNGVAILPIEDEKNFKNIAVSECVEDGHNQLWFVSLSNKVYYRKSSGSIQPFVFNNNISNKVFSNRGPIKYSFRPYNDSSLLISLKDMGALWVKKSGEVVSKYEKMENVVFDFSEPKPFISFLDKKQPFRNVDVILPSKQIIKIPSSVYPTHLYSAKLKDGTLLISIDKSLFVIKGTKFKEIKMDDAITGIYQDRQDFVWLLINGVGAQRYANTDFNAKPVLTILKKEIVTSILQDKEGSFWFSTLNSGVYFVSSLAFTNYTTIDGLKSNKISKVFYYNGSVWVGYIDGFVSQIKPDGTIVHYSAPQAYNSAVRGLSADPTDNSILVSSDKLYKIKNGRVELFENTIKKSCPELEKEYSLLPRSIQMFEKGYFWIASNRGIKKLQGNKIVYDSYRTGDYKGFVYSVTEDDKHDVWFGGYSLYHLSNGKVEDLGEKHSILNVGINKLLYNPYDKKVWIGTKGQGVIVYSKGRIYKIRTDHGLQSNNVLTLDVSGNKVWVGSTKGVDCITILDAAKFKIDIRNFNSSHGLISDDVRDLCVAGRYIYIATISGLTRFDTLTYLRNNTPPTVVISSVRVNDRDTTISAPLHLKYYQNFIDITFDGLTFKKELNQTYRYRLEGLSEKWFYTSENKLRFYKLPAGSYHLYVEAQNNDGKWSVVPAEFTFSIDKPFWQTYWFYLLSLCIVGSIVFIIMRSRLKMLSKITLYERKGNIWKNQSLSLQMNPHFIFNTLNSIQLFILKCDVDSSLYYLSKFSNLMRKTLENSNHINITLKEELEVLGIYLELEKLRSESKFSYSIECDESIIQTETYIPTLLIQPFVENSIWHGIMPKTETGHISIKILDSGSFIRCCVVDDGIGRVKSMELKQNSNRHKHKSYATRIVSNRMEILKVLYKKDFGLKYVDKYKDDGTSAGTEVIIIVPKDFHKTKLVPVLD